MPNRRSRGFLVLSASADRKVPEHSRIPRQCAFPLQPCGKDDVRVKIAYCGIYGSDVHEYLGAPIFLPLPCQKSPRTGVELPVVMGHEMSGTITEVGSAITELKIGQNVAINPSMDDRHHGKEDSGACYGLSARGGGFADEIVVKPCSCIPVPEGVTLRVAAFAEPLAVVSHMIRISGFNHVTESRSRQAEKFGADLVVNPLAKSSSDVDAGYCAVGVKPGGVVFNVAIHEKPLLINPDSSFLKVVKLMGRICYTNEGFEDVLGAFMSGKLAAEDVITSIVPLEYIVQGGFLELINNKAEHVKILIQPSKLAEYRKCACKQLITLPKLHL
ncbi:chaperonin 10-like protein [Bisporella sp. PMI_857]|nr:chaperonin 10-like protein [Bisporella sp. PMI_857]